ncbi:hypothetical protein CTI12_AA331980 [Artemisia annua]|uniref:Uncharacterized protein n=1 Tax=Artemisia annua TaxID=35608 RepID=A0A2U1MXN2_ARTAN|nr:hypothetical protein CTI12_AA331980 [Artemisia annua]
MAPPSVAPPSTQYFAPQGNQSMRPPPQSGPLPSQGVGGPSFPAGGGLAGPGLSNSNVSGDWLGGRGVGATVPKPQEPLSSSSFTAPRTSVGGNAITSAAMFGGDLFSASQSISKPSSTSMPTQTASIPPVSSAIAPVTSEPQTPAKIDPLGALNAFTRQPTGAPVQSAGPSLPKPNQQAPTQNAPVQSGGPLLLQWPKMTRAGVNKCGTCLITKNDKHITHIWETCVLTSFLHQAEMLAKKYEEKYKQVAEVASELTIEEASFRDIQERKMELNQALVKMDQGGSADGILQVRADRIQSDLEELLKALTERCKKHGIDVKSTAVIELPKGFSFDATVPANTKSTSQAENSSAMDDVSEDSYSNADKKSEKPFETESVYAHSEDMPLQITSFIQEHEKHGESYFFDSNSFTASPRKSDSPQGSNSFFQKKSPFGSTQDNNFSRFDSMSSTAQDRSFARFDSMSSNAGFDHGHTYSFDDSDPFGSSGPFKVLSESQTGKNETDKWAF